jgi:MarR family 2-MHQ and catechol resistance regulon transcriptional repressor
VKSDKVAEPLPSPAPRFRAGREELATTRLLLAIAKAFKRVDDRVRPKMMRFGLSMTEFAVLEALYHHGPLPLGELSGRILITGASTTYTVKKLESRGLMTRTVCEEDHRIVLGCITVRGKELIARVFPSHVQDLVEAMRGLGAADKNIAADLLNKIAND